MPPVRQKLRGVAACSSDRVAELEAKIEALTKLLNIQNINTASGVSTTSELSQEGGSVDVETPPKTPPLGNVKKRRLEAPSSQVVDKTKGDVDDRSIANPVVGVSLELDALVSQETQIKILNKYRNEIQPRFSLASLITVGDYSDEGIEKVVFDLLSPNAIAESEKSMELVQALQLAAFWYRIPKHHLHLPIFQLIQLAIEVAEEIGIGGPNCSISDGSTFSNESVSAGDAWRMARMNLMEFNFVVDIADPVTQVDMHGLQNLITDWKAQIPVSISCGILQMWEHFAVLYLHESVLHTPTNTESFAGPYIAERLSVTDFPTPVVTPDHAVSLHTIRDACHAMLDIFINLDIATFMGFPPGIIITQAFYAQWILIKLLVSVTAPGNTYGALLDPQSLQLEHYLIRMINFGVEVSKHDSGCVQARILNSIHRVKEWVCAYNESHGKQTAFFENATNAESFLGPEGFGFGESSAIQWDAFAFNDPYDYGLGDLFGYTV
ncbi:hypothetical protein D0Z07_4634 [Hyphodiscus hymeniophilus]|uniref:Uncharacterized protein n=1 Tax=Hyphodiscus hymeniophilus TaxID=353542 RepID=A0A9P7AWS0_9HELO|nr:hypothetical protein D0Z07_4634 [Hyphodiscus hymeniophilus]